MRRITLYTLVLLFTVVFLQPVGAQSRTTDWQEQMLQLIDVDEFSEEQYARLLEMVEELDAQSQPGSRPMRIRQEMVLRANRCLNRRAGYRDASADRREAGQAYLGDPWHEALRYQLQVRDTLSRQWRAGLVADKGSGERWQSHAPWADAYSLYAQMQAPKGWLRQVVLGHYRLRLGSGLLINQQFNMGKGLMADAYMQKHPDLSVHSSAAEGDYLLGAAMRVRLGQHLECLPFVSVRPIDGVLKHDTLTSWSTDGYHRTISEAAKRNNGWLSNAGLRMQTMGEWWEVAANVMYSQLNHDYVRPWRAYNQHYFRGHELLQTSADYRVQYMGFAARGEVAIDDRGGWATVDALNHGLGDNGQITLLYRHYSHDYRQLWGASVAESSGMQGEQGVMLMTTNDVSRHLQLQTMFDWFRFNKPQYGIVSPSSGYEASVKALSSYDKHSVSVRYRLKFKHKTHPVLGDALSAYYRHSVDAVWMVQPQQGWRLKTQARSRFYSVSHLGGLQTGWAFSQAIGWGRSGSALRGEVQGAWFKADDYDCRIYLTESNVRYGYSVPMLYGEGWRGHCTLYWQISPMLVAEAKYSLSGYKKPGIGSGLQHIDGHYVHDLLIQLQLKIDPPTPFRGRVKSE